MLTKVLLVLALVIAAVLTYVALKPGDFQIARQATIAAPPEAIFPHIEDLNKFNAWNPWAKLDPNAKFSYEGPASGPGAVHTWDGNKDVGAGRMIVTDSTPNTQVKMRLDFERPFKGTNHVTFTLTPDGNQTTVQWAMEGKSAFVPRLFCFLMNMNMEDMIGGSFEKGLADLKAIVEKGA